MLSVNVIGKSNGVGLTRDLTLAAEALRAAGCDVTVTKIDRAGAKRRRSKVRQWTARWALYRSEQRTRPFDVNVMLEHLWPEYLALARHNVALPNPEWFDRHDLRWLPRIDRVWAKTRNTQTIYEGLGCKVALTGFDSEDRSLAGVTKQKTFFHLAGRSTMKGTGKLLEVWARNAQWPVLTVVQHEPRAGQPAGANIRYRCGYLDETELKRLQNESLFHLCLSQTEGWGHYIVEAMSAGAVVLTTNAPPMNELVEPSRGVWIDSRPSGRQKLAQTFSFDEPSLAGAIERLLVASEGELRSKSANARQWFEANKQGFSERLAAALRTLDQSTSRE